MEPPENMKKFAVMMIEKGTVCFKERDKIFPAALKYLDETKQFIQFPKGPYNPEDEEKFLDLIKQVKVPLPLEWVWIPCNIIWYCNTLQDAEEKVLYLTRQKGDSVRSCKPVSNHGIMAANGPVLTMSPQNSSQSSQIPASCASATRTTEPRRVTNCSTIKVTSNLDQEDNFSFPHLPKMSTQTKSLRKDCVAVVVRQPPVDDENRIIHSHLEKESSSTLAPPGEVEFELQDESRLQEESRLQKESRLQEIPSQEFTAEFSNKLSANNNPTHSAPTIIMEDNSLVPTTNCLLIHHDNSRHNEIPAVPACVQDIPSSSREPETDIVQLNSNKSPADESAVAAGSTKVKTLATKPKLAKSGDSSSGAVKRTERIDLSFVIEIDGDKWKSIEPRVVQQTDRTTQKLQKGWTEVIREKIWDDHQLPCSFAFKDNHFFATVGSPYFEIYGACTDKNCQCKLLGTCKTQETDRAIIEIEITNLNRATHTKKVPLSGNSRSIAKTELRACKPLAFQHEVANRLLQLDSEDSVTVKQCPFVATTAVYSKARQEDKNERLEMKPFEGSDVVTALMKMMEAIPHIRAISTIPFYVWFWSQLQTFLWNLIAARHGKVSIDASGGLPNAFEIFKGHKCSNIFLYNIVTYIENQDKIYTIAQSLSSAHDTKTIYSWIVEWQDSGAAAPKECTLDGSGALLNAFCLAVLGLYYTDYLNICMKIILLKVQKKSIPRYILPKCLVKRDRPHLLNALCNWKVFEKDNWVKKDFYARSVAFASEIYEWADLQRLMSSVFIVANSKTCSPGSKCFDATEWLKSKIATFEVIEESQQEMVSDSYEYVGQNLEDCAPKCKAYVLKIHNESMPLCDNCITRTFPNRYYLPKSSDNFIALFAQFPAWTCLMNPFYPGSSQHPTSARSETFYKILKRDYEMKSQKAVPKFIKSFFDKVEGATKLAILSLQTAEGLSA